MKILQRGYFSLVVLLLIWLVVGIYFGVLVYPVIFISLILLRNKDSYGEILIGFFFLLILSDSFEHSLKFAKTIKGFYLLLMFLIFLKDSRSFSPKVKIFMSFIPFFFIGLIALTKSETYAVSIQKYVSYVLLFVVVPNYFIKAYSQNGVAFLKQLCYFYLAILCLGFLWGFIDFDLAYSHGGRLRGLFGNPNGLGLMLTVFFAFFFLIQHQFENLFSKAEKLFFYFLIGLLVLKCGSRNSMTAIGILVILYPLARFSAFFSVLVFSATMLFYNEIFDGFIELIVALKLEDLFRLETLESGAGRYVVWEFAWEHIQDNFFLGKGFAFDEYIVGQYAYILSDLGHEGGVHNTYLIIWLNTGIVGLLVFLSAFFGNFFGASKQSLLAIPVMFSFMFSIMFEPWLAASLNPYTSVFLMTITLMIYKPYFKNNEVLVNEKD